MLSPVRGDVIRNRRMSPAPRRKPAAFEKVGAAATALAAKAPSNARRVMPEELLSVICLAPVPYLARSVRYPANSVSVPQVRETYRIKRITDQACFDAN